MPTLDVYIYASKRDEHTLIAHAGTVQEDRAQKTRAGRVVPGAYQMRLPGGGMVFGQLVESLHGMDPHNVDITTIEAGLDPEQKRVAYQFLVDLDLALKHAAKVRAMRTGAIGGGQIGELYEDVSIRVKRDGQLLG